MAMTFDTRRAAQKLTEAGVDADEADAIVEVMGDATSPLVTQENLRGELAEFRADIRAEFAEFRAEIRAEFTEFGAELRADMKDMRAEFYRAMVIQTGVFAGIVAAIVALLTRL